MLPPFCIKPLQEDPPVAEETEECVKAIGIEGPAPAFSVFTGQTLEPETYSVARHWIDLVLDRRFKVAFKQFQFQLVFGHFSNSLSINLMASLIPSNLWSLNSTSSASATIGPDFL